MREIENFEAGAGILMTGAAYGIINVAGGIGDAIGNAIRQAAHLKAVDAHTRQLVRQNFAAAAQKKSDQQATDALLVAYNLKLYNAKIAAA